MILTGLFPYQIQTRNQNILKGVKLLFTCRLATITYGHG